MEKAREYLHQQGHIAKVTLGHKGTDIRKLTVVLPEEGNCVVHYVEGATREQVACFLSHFGQTFRGQSLPAAVQTVLFELVRPSREHLSPEQRKALLAEQQLLDLDVHNMSVRLSSFESNFQNLNGKDCIIQHKNMKKSKKKLN